MKLQFSPQAVIDLTEILDYVARDNPRAALKLVEGIEVTCENLAQSPGMGSARADLLRGLRAFSRGSYVIYFLTVPSGAVRIVRVLHGGRDVQPGDLRPHA